MIDPHRYLLFLGAALFLLLTPGPAVLYIVENSMAQGTRAGISAALGLVLGGSVHMLAALMGLTALLAASSSGLLVLQVAGGAYLLWLAWAALRRAPPAEDDHLGEGPGPRSHGRIFRGAILVNVLNPKAALFFLAFLPQFVDPSRGDPRAQFLVLAGSFLVVAFATDTSYAVLGGRVGRSLHAPGAHRVRQWLSAAIYAALGVAALVEGWVA